MEPPPSGGRMASQQERPWPPYRHRCQPTDKRLLNSSSSSSSSSTVIPAPHQLLPTTTTLCSGGKSSTSTSTNSTSSAITIGGSSSKQHSNNSNSSSSSSSSSTSSNTINKSPPPTTVTSRSAPHRSAASSCAATSNRPSGAGTEAQPAAGPARTRSGTRALAPTAAATAEGEGFGVAGGGMQRHRKKDRSERSAPPTIQKYLQFAGGSAGGGVPHSATGLVGASENLYQPCGGGSLLSHAHTAALDGELIGLKGSGPASPLDEPIGAVDAAPGKGCCRKGDLRTGCYPEDNPDSIEVYRDKQQQLQQQQQGISSYTGGLRMDVPDPCAGVGGPCHQLPYPGKWSCGGGGPGDGFSSFPPGESGEHSMPHQQHLQQHPTRQQRLGSDGTTSCASDPATSGSSGVGSAEYSYAYCEPILLQHSLVGDGPPASSLAPSSSTYCVPVYHHHHPPALPLPLHQRQQRSLRGFPHGPGRTGGPPYGARSAGTTLHHHHHHHHHNYTLPNSGGSASGSKGPPGAHSTLATAATTATATTTTTGSLRALFTNFFRKSASSASSSSSSSSASSASGAVLNAAFSATPPFLDGVGDGAATLHHHRHGPLPPPERHSFTTCYGTKENIYEDIGSQSALQPSPGAAGSTPTPVPTMGATTATTPTPALPSTSVTTPPPPPPTLSPNATASPTGPGAFHSVAAEWRRVQVQHERIIGELNLSVERLIMPSYDDEHCCPDQQHLQVQELSFKAPPPAPAPSAPAGSALASSSGSSSQSAGPSKRLHFTSSPSTSLAVVERHSPTISYGKSYGDVDSGISSSSTSGTSYSSSILYRSITNYPPQQDGAGPISSSGGQASTHHQHHHQQPQQHQQQARKLPLFGSLRAHPGAGSALTLSGVRTTGSSCSGRAAHFLHPSRPGAAGGGSLGVLGTVPGGTDMSGPNAPDAPPPETVASCCFFTEHRQHQPPLSGFPATTHWSGSCARPERPNATGGGNFWTRFRRLHGRLTSSSGKQQQQQQQQQNQSDLHSDVGFLTAGEHDDFGPAGGGSIWPMQQYAPHSHQYYHHHHHPPQATHAHHLHHLQQLQHRPAPFEAHQSSSAGTPRDDGPPTAIALQHHHQRDFPQRYPTSSSSSTGGGPSGSASVSPAGGGAAAESASLVGLVTHEEEDASEVAGGPQHEVPLPVAEAQQLQQKQPADSNRPHSPSSPSPSSSSSSSSSSGSRSSAASVGSSRSSPASVGSSDAESPRSSPSPSPVAKLTG